MCVCVCVTHSSRSSSRVQTPAPPGSDASSEVSSDPWGDGLEEGRLVPQLRMDKDGSIVLDEGRSVYTRVSEDCFLIGITQR